MSPEQPNAPADWFKTPDRTACPLCGREDAAATSIGTVYCRSCGEVVGPAGEDA